MVERIVVVTKKTVLDELLERHYSLDQLAFFLETRNRKDDLEGYRSEDACYKDSFRLILGALPNKIASIYIERAQVSRFAFRPTDLVVTIGPDGLCVNTMKYINGQKVIAVNPDPGRINGVLCRFSAKAAVQVLARLPILENLVDQLTFAEARTNDGQSLLAVNDFLIGRRDQVSAYYKIIYGGKVENQSSSGVLVSTPLGGSGWFSSLLSGASEMALNFFGLDLPKKMLPKMAWDKKELIFAVREPFESKSTGASIVCGRLGSSSSLTLVSRMPEGGVVFSDGVTSDALEFNSGTELTVKVASVCGSLVSP